MILVVRKERIIFCFSLKKFLKLPLNYTGQDKIILGYEQLLVLGSGCLANKVENN